MLATGDPKVCRICLERTDSEQLLSPCHCKGTMQYIHLACLQRCVHFSGSEKCSICGQKWIGVETVRIMKSFVDYLREKCHLSEFLLYSFFAIFAVLTLFVMLAPEHVLTGHAFTRYLVLGYSITRLVYELLIVIGAIFYLSDTLFEFLVWRKINYKLVIVKRDDQTRPIVQAIDMPN